MQESSSYCRKVTTGIRGKKREKVSCKINGSFQKQPALDRPYVTVPKKIFPLPCSTAAERAAGKGKEISAYFPRPRPAARRGIFVDKRPHIEM